MQNTTRSVERLSLTIANRMRIEFDCIFVGHFMIDMHSLNGSDTNDEEKQKVPEQWTMKLPTKD